MSKNLIRVYKKKDANEIKPHLMTYGDLSASCANCNHIGFKLDDKACPQCKAEFKYIAFRNIRTHVPKVHKLIEERSDLEIIDFEDYKRALGDSKAKDFFG
ncbi:MAG: hypothetical protein P9X22_01600 [Candidatus Zapsychrus exili]|nr:hypothetical protein [Candidatus Zapsychrus exili]